MSNIITFPADRFIDYTAANNEPRVLSQDEAHTLNELSIEIQSLMADYLDGGGNAENLVAMIPVDAN
jgi:hypothetical protein